MESKRGYFGCLWKEDPMGCRVGVLRVVSGLFVLGIAGSLAGGMLTGCSVTPMSGVTCDLKSAVTPATATADHAATAPGDQQAFNVGFVGSMQGCPAIPQFIAAPS